MAIDIVYVNNKLAREFGRPVKHFTDTGVETLWDNPQQSDMMDLFIMRKRCDAGVQAASLNTEHEINTKRFIVRESSMTHMEGGWPKEIDVEEIEQTIRFKRKIEKDSDFISSLCGLGDRLEGYLRQNCTTDIYEDYWDGDDSGVVSEGASLKTVTVLRDPGTRAGGRPRTVTDISYHPETASKLACSYGSLQFQGPTQTHKSSYVWDITNTNFPQMELTPPSSMVVLQYNQKDQNLILGGCYNGLLAAFDTRVGASPVEVSPIEKSHRDPVYDCAWMQSKTGTEFVTTSTDGQLLWWDMRKLVDATERIMLEVPKAQGQDSRYYVRPGGMTIGYDVTAGPAKFLIGSEQGSILFCNKKAKTPQEQFNMMFEGHHGPVYGLQRNPFFSKFFASCGDWSTRIWYDEMKYPIISSRYDTAMVTDLTWSCTRPAVLYTGKEDGRIDIWDYHVKQAEPVVSMQGAPSGIHCMAIYNSGVMQSSESGRFLSVGAVDGSTTVFEASDALVRQQNGEKQSMQAMLEREAKREKALEARRKEKTAAAARRALAEDEEKEKAVAAAKKEKAVSGPDALKAVEKGFFAMVAREEEEEEKSAGRSA